MRVNARKRTVLFFWVACLLLAVDYSFLMVPMVSSANIQVNPASAQGAVASGAGITQNFGNNVTISGNLTISGNSVVNFAGPSASLPVKVYLNGSINIVDNGTLTLKYATLYFVGANKPYDRYIRLSNSTNGHPRLIIVNSTIDAYPTTTVKGRTKTTVSYGVGVYAYGNSEIYALKLNVYREIAGVNTKNYSSGGPTVIKAYDEASVNLTSVTVDSVLTYDKAQVSIYGGSGPKRLSKVASPPDAGIYFEGHNSSTVALYGVVFKNITASDESHLLLTHCTELLSGVITAVDRSTVNCYGDTTLTNSEAAPKPPATAPILISAINASGYSYVSVSSSTISSLLPGNPIVSVYDHATIAILQKDTITSGNFVAFGHSAVVLSTNESSDLENIGILAYNSSSVSIINTTIQCAPFTVQIGLFGGSHLSVVGSALWGGWINFFDNSTVYVSHSLLQSSSVVEDVSLRMACHDSANVTIVHSQILADSLEMYDNSRLNVDLSHAIVIYCLNSSQVSLANGTVTELSVSENSRVRVMNSTLKELSLAYSNVTGSLEGLTSFFKNSTFALSGSNSAVSVLNTTIGELSFSFWGHSNVTISNSTIRNLSLQGSSFATLNNTSFYGSVYVAGHSRVLMYSPLRVRCVGYFGNPLNGSVVTIETGYVGAPTVLQTQTADKNGFVTFVLFSEMDNATGTFPFGLVTVSGSFQGVSTSQDVSVGLINKDVTLSFALPSWSVYLLPLVVFIVIVALLILAYYALKRVRGKKE